MAAGNLLWNGGQLAKEIMIVAANNRKQEMSRGLIRKEKEHERLNRKGIGAEAVWKNNNKFMIRNKERKTYDYK